MEKLILIGYAGHGFVATDIAAQSDFEIIGYIEKEEKIKNPYGLRYLGSHQASILNTYSDAFTFIAIGDNELRGNIYKNLTESGQESQLTSLISRFSTIANQSTIGKGSMVCANAILNPMVKVGVGCILNTGSIIEHECEIGNFSHIAPGAVLTGNVKVGNYSFVGANAVVKQGVNIGNNVTIGAGCVVISDIEDGVTVVGNPGKIIDRK